MQVAIATVAQIEPTDPARRGRPDDRLSEIRERVAGLNANPGFRCAQSGLLAVDPLAAERSE
jgi:hypothetical protein